MPRPPRRDADSGIHHVMNRGVDHGAVFFGDADRVEFGRRLAAVHEGLGVTTLAYCLMGNHFHLLLRAAPGALSEAMQHLTSVSTRHTNARIGRDGPLFRGRFHSTPLETDGYLVWACRYIHRNPLDVPGVHSPRDYRWSSYRTYLGVRPAPAFLDLRPVMDLLGGGRATLVAVTEESHPAACRLAAEDVRAVVAWAVAAEDVAHPSETDARWLDRTAMVLLGERTTDPALRRTLARELGLRSPGAAAAATRRAERRLELDPRVRRILRRVEAELDVGATVSA